MVLDALLFEPSFIAYRFYQSTISKKDSNSAYVINNSTGNIAEDVIVNSLKSKRCRCCASVCRDYVYEARLQNLANRRSKVKPQSQLSQVEQSVNNRSLLFQGNERLLKSLVVSLRPFLFVVSCLPKWQIFAKITHAQLFRTINCRLLFRSHDRNWL